MNKEIFLDNNCFIARNVFDIANKMKLYKSIKSGNKD